MFKDNVYSNFEHMWLAHHTCYMHLLNFDFYMAKFNNSLPKCVFFLGSPFYCLVLRAQILIMILNFLINFIITMGRSNLNLVFFVGNTKNYQLRQINVYGLP